MHAGQLHFECLMRYGEATVAQMGLDISHCWTIGRCSFLNTQLYTLKPSVLSNGKLLSSPSCQI